MRYIIIISIAFITLLASSCGNTCSIGAKTKVLTGRKWEISSYIDYSVNREISMPKEEYEFSADGTMLKVKNCDTIRETWDIPESVFCRKNKVLAFGALKHSREVSFRAKGWY